MREPIRDYPDRKTKLLDKIEYDTNGGCWLWRLAPNSTGYGIFRWNKAQTLAHRVSYEEFRGPIPDSDDYHGTCVLHRCDTPACVNPDHLFLGSQADNVADMRAKGRQGDLSGEKHPGARLTNAQAVELRRRAIAGEPYARLAEEFGVSRPTVSFVKTGRAYKGITACA